MKLLNSTIFNISRRADCCHVGQSDREVIRFIVSQLKKSTWKTVETASRKKLYRAIIERHRNNQGLYDLVVTGRF